MAAPATPTDRWLPYALAVAGLLAGLAVVLFAPLPWRGANLGLGAVLLGAAAGSVYYLVARGGGPGERGPDF